MNVTTNLSQATQYVQNKQIIWRKIEEAVDILSFSVKVYGICCPCYQLGENLKYKSNITTAA